MTKRARAGRLYRGVAAGDRSAERRARFVEAGLELFGTQGFAATTVKALCTQAGLTERYFYESFENREALFEAVALVCVSGLMSELVAAAAKQDHGDTEALSRSMLGAFFRWFASDPRRTRIQLFEPLVMGVRFQSLYREVVAAFSETVRGATMGRYEKPLASLGVDTRLLSQVMVGAAVKMVEEWHHDGYRRPVDELLRTGVLLFGALAQSVERSVEAKPRRARSA